VRIREEKMERERRGKRKGRERVPLDAKKKPSLFPPFFLKATDSRRGSGHVLSLSNIATSTTVVFWR